MPSHSSPSSQEQPSGDADSQDAPPTIELPENPTNEQYAEVRRRAMSPGHLIKIIQRS